MAPGALEIFTVATSEDQLRKFRKVGRLVVSEIPLARHLLDRAVGLGIGIEITGPRRLLGTMFGVEFEVVARRA